MIVYDSVAIDSVIDGALCLASCVPLLVAVAAALLLLL